MLFQSTCGKSVSRLTGNPLCCQRQLHYYITPKSINNQELNNRIIAVPKKRKERNDMKQIEKWLQDNGITWCPTAKTNIRSVKQDWQCILRFAGAIPAKRNSLQIFLKILDTSITRIVGVCLSVWIMLTQKINTNATDTPAPWLRPAAGLRPAGGI